MENRPKVLVGCTGSVASIKVPGLVQELSKFYQVKVIPTEKALHFFSPESLIATTTTTTGLIKDPLLAMSAQILTTSDEWSAWTNRSDPILHIELRNWADIVVIAPLDANTLAKIAQGLCDNLLTCVLRAWDNTKPVLVAPAMNTHMWNHVFTAKHLDILQSELAYGVIQPVSKPLMCGDVGMLWLFNDSGMGAMASVSDIVAAVRASLDAQRHHPLYALNAMDCPASVAL